MIMIIKNIPKFKLQVTGSILLIASRVMFDVQVHSSRNFSIFREHICFFEQTFCFRCMINFAIETLQFYICFLCLAHCGLVFFYITSGYIFWQSFVQFLLIVTRYWCLSNWGHIDLCIPNFILQKFAVK